MAHTLQLTLGGSTIDLNSGSMSLIEYVPQSPNLSTIDTNTILMDGGERTLTTRRNVTEVASVRFTNTDKIELQSQKQTIQNWLMYAETGNEIRTGAASPLYINYAPDGTSGSVYQSEIFGGKVNLDTESLDYRWTGASSVLMNISWSRRYYWEHDEITLSTHNGSGHSTCPVVNNHNPQDYAGTNTCWNNWVQIDASAINVGEIPSPAIIEIENDSGSTLDTRYFHIFYNRLSSPTSFPHILQGEDNEYVSATASTVVSADTSKGEYEAVKYSSSPNWESMFRWTIPSASLIQMGGNYFNVLARFFNDPEPLANTASTFMQVKLLQDTSHVVCEGEVVEIDVDREMQSLGIIRIPPLSGRLGGTANYYHDLRLDIFFKLQTGDGLNDFAIDYVQLSPLDGYRLLKQPVYAWTDAYLVVDDPKNDSTYMAETESGLLKSNLIMGEGQPIYLWPNENQRLYFNIDGDKSSFSALSVHTQTKVRIKYRPRRLTI